MSSLTTTTTYPYNCLLLLYHGFNTLDANGPLEVFRKSGLSKKFGVTITSENEHTTSAEGLIVKRHVPLDQNLIDSLDEYDILIVPGSGAKNIEDLAAAGGVFPRLIDRFSKMKTKEGRPDRVLLSICTGAIFFGALGIFSGKYCTTHWDFYEPLKMAMQKVAAKSGGPVGTVLPARFVDSGKNQSGVNIISAGGISCGIDASLHVVKKYVSEEEALETANLLDYAWRKTEGVTFEDI